MSKKNKISYLIEKWLKIWIDILWIDKKWKYVS